MANETSGAYQPIYVPSTKNTRTGLWLIFTPLAVTALLAIVSFAFKESVFASVVMMGLTMFSFFVFICLAGVGAVLLFVKEPAPGVTFDPRSGVAGGEVPAEIKGWNWGAAFLGVIWGVYHGVWISLLSFVPILNFVWWIVMGLRGNEWAWQKRKWVSPEQFKASQWGWNRMGMVMLGYVAIIVLMEGLVFATMASVGRSFGVDSGYDDYGDDGIYGSDHYNYSDDNYYDSDSNDTSSDYDDYDNTRMKYPSEPQTTPVKIPSVR